MKCIVCFFNMEKMPRVQLVLKKALHVLCNTTVLNCFVIKAQCSLTNLFLAVFPFHLFPYHLLTCFSLKACLHSEGHMDDGLTLQRCQHEESRAARIIRNTTLLFNRFIRCAKYNSPVSGGVQISH